MKEFKFESKWRKFVVDGILKEEMKGEVEKKTLNEYTDNSFSGGEVIDRVNEKGPDMLGQQLFKDLLPQGVTSEFDAVDALRASDQSPIKARMGQYAPMFVHKQYHEFDHEGEEYRLHQTQYYNSNFKDTDPSFNPKVTELRLSKITKRGTGNFDRDETEEVGTILVKTDEYIKDLKNLNITKRQS